MSEGSKDEVLPPQWIKNTDGFQPVGGESYIIAVRVRNNRTKREYWQIDQINIIWYDDGPHLYQGPDAYTDWDWESVDYYMKSEMP